MNRLDKIAVLTALVATILGIFGSREFPYEYYADQMLPGGLPVAIAGWSVTTYGPLIVSVTFWRLAKRLQPPRSLVLHLLYLPVAILVFRLGEAVMLALITDPDFDATMSAPEMPALFALAVSTVAYFGAVANRRNLKA